jgi:hypothetical protein
MSAACWVIRRKSSFSLARILSEAVYQKLLIPRVRQKQADFEHR